MKKSYSFLVEIITYGLSDKTCKSANSTSHQPYEDYLALNEYSPFPKNRKNFKITYILAPKTGKFTVILSGRSNLNFKFTDKEKITPGGYFINCLIENCDWPEGTRFNRKVEVIKRRVK